MDIYILFRHLPSLFKKFASRRLAAATELMTEELAAGSVLNNSGVKSGIVSFNGHLISNERKLTDDEFFSLGLSDGTRKSIGIPVERLVGENRVGATPTEVAQLRKKKFTVYVETGAGVGSNITDEEYKQAGAIIVSRDEVWKKSDIIRKVRAPLADEQHNYFRDGLILEAFLFLNNPESEALRTALTARGVTAIAYEKVINPGYVPLSDLLFELRGVGADLDDRSNVAIDPMRRVAGSISALIALFLSTLYHPDHGFRELASETGIVGDDQLKNPLLHLGRFLEDIEKHELEFKNHSHNYPKELREQAGITDTNREMNVLILGGNLNGRAAALEIAKLRSKNIKVTIFVPSQKAADLLEAQFRDDGFLRAAVVNAAQSAANKVNLTRIPGGINLDPKNMQMDISGNKVSTNFNPAMIQKLRSENFIGVEPSIIDITRVINPFKQEAEVGLAV